MSNLQQEKKFNVDKSKQKKPILSTREFEFQTDIIFKKNTALLNNIKR
jgi:hypothetical protein